MSLKIVRRFGAFYSIGDSFVRAEAQMLGRRSGTLVVLSVILANDPAPAWLATDKQSLGRYLGDLWR